MLQKTTTKDGRCPTEYTNKGWFGNDYNGWATDADGAPITDSYYLNICVKTDYMTADKLGDFIHLGMRMYGGKEYQCADGYYDRGVFQFKGYPWDYWDFAGVLWKNYKKYYLTNYDGQAVYNNWAGLCVMPVTIKI